MTTRFILCEGPDDMNALRAVAQCLCWAKPVRASATVSGAGQERLAKLLAGDIQIDICVPSRARSGCGEGKSALARSVADYLGALPPQGTRDESLVSLVATVFDPDDEPVSRFHAEVAEAIRDGARAWTLTETTPGTWHAARRDGAEQVEVRAVHWRAPGAVLDGLPNHENLERLLCAVVAEAYPNDVADVARWLTEINERRVKGGRKPATWKAAVHVWAATVYEKIDELNAASRFLHQQDECRPHVERLLADVGLIEDLRHLLGPPALSQPSGW